MIEKLRRDLVISLLGAGFHPDIIPNEADKLIKYIENGVTEKPFSDISNFAKLAHQPAPKPPIKWLDKE
jgi:hypothetical protein